MVAFAFHRHQAWLDIPVATKLLPANLDIDAHHEIGSIYGEAPGLPALAPLPLHRHASKHTGLAGANSGAACRTVLIWCVPEVGQHIHATRLNLGGLGVL